MADDSSAAKVDPGLVTRIVGSYVMQNRVEADQLAGLITEVHRSLSGLGQQTSAPEALAPAVSVRQSVRRDYVVCLECGFRGQVIRRHLSVGHGLTPEQYRERWKLPGDHPITAPAYSERRSTMAKQIGLGRGRQMTAVETPPAAKRRGRPRRTAAE